MTTVAQPKISVAMIGSNSERYLEEVLGSVAWADEIVLVLDPASQDRTRAIARAHGVRIIEQAWAGFAAQKNAAIAATRHPWVLSLDCDEVVDLELQAAIARAEFERWDAFAIARKNHLGKQWVRHSGFYPDCQIRLFRRELRFDNRPVHEQLEVTGKRVGTLAGHLIHFTYVDVAEYVTKVRRYAQLDAEVLSREGRRWSWLYQVGKPIREFVDRFILQHGFLDGTAGWHVAWISAYGRFVAAAHLRELEERASSR